MKKLLNKIGVDLANKIINKFPISAPRNALLYYINKGKEEEKRKKVVLDSVTVLDDNKALLTYKSNKSYYTKKIDYRRGEIKPIDIVVIGPYV
jgi:hypothetical protein